MEEEGVERFGKIHHTIWGDSRKVVERIVTIGEAILTRRGASWVERAGDDVVACVTQGRGHVVSGGTEDGVRWDIYVHGEDRVGVKYARAVLEECEERGSRAIVVSIDGPTPFTRKECEGRSIQFFPAREMCVDLVEHCLVPKHEAVDAPPPGVTKEELPRMESTDKVAQYYDWKPGTVVKITRVFGGSEPIPYYRLVVPASTS